MRDALIRDLATKPGGELPPDADPEAYCAWATSTADELIKRDQRITDLEARIDELEQEPRGVVQNGFSLEEVGKLMVEVIKAVT